MSLLRYTLDGVDHVVELKDLDADGQTWADFFEFVRRVHCAWIQTGRVVDNQLPPWAPRPVVMGAPAYLSPGDGNKAKDALGGIITVAADGSVWRDGARLGGAFVRRIAVYGASIFALAKSSDTDFSWSGATWSVATLDHSVIVW